MLWPTNGFFPLGDSFLVLYLKSCRIEGFIEGCMVEWNDVLKFRFPADLGAIPVAVGIQAAGGCCRSESASNEPWLVMINTLGPVLLCEFLMPLRCGMTL